MRGLIPILVALFAVMAVPFLFRQPEIDNFYLDRTWVLDDEKVARFQISVHASL